MPRAESKLLLILLIVSAVCSCIDPYTPKLNGYESLLVVDGSVTDESASYTVRLSRTLQDPNDNPPLVSDATVFITDDNSSQINMKYYGNGTYITDRSEFRGVAGRTYVLHIITGDGNEYQSDPCLMQPVPEIDSLYYAKDQEVFNNGTEIQEGIRIYLDSRGSADSKYYRWAFTEIWEFKVPNPKKYDFISEDLIVPVERETEFCWKKQKSTEVLIHAVYSAGKPGIEKEPIFFIASDKSDRLSMQYSILVSQYSISKNEYDFWDNLKKVNTTGGDIFATQPFPVISNIHNVKNPGEKVLGYFQVSAVKQKRMDILFSDIVGLKLPLYHYPCERIERSPSDYMTGFGPPVRWSEVDTMWTVYAHYYFVEPVYIPGTLSLKKLVFAKPECADCALTGTAEKPDF